MGPNQNRHSDSLKKDQLTPSQFMMWKRDDVAVDDHDDALRTSVVTKPSNSDTTYQEVVPKDSVYIQLFPHIRQVKVWGGRNGRSTDTEIGPSWVYMSQLGLHAIQQGL